MAVKEVKFEKKGIDCRVRVEDKKLILLAGGLEAEVEATNNAGYGWNYRTTNKAMTELFGASRQAKLVLLHGSAEEMEKARRRNINPKRTAEREAKIEEAKRTGKIIELYSFPTGCNDPEEECDIDIVTGYAMPDGSIKEKRIHTW